MLGYIVRGFLRFILFFLRFLVIFVWAVFFLGVSL